MGGLWGFQPPPASTPGESEKLADPRQDIRGEGIGLSGSKGPAASASYGLEGERVEGGVVGLLDATGGVEVGDRGSGLIDEGDGLASGR